MRGFQSIAVTLLRIAAGLAFFSHGAQKLFGWFGGVGPDGGHVAYFSQMGLAGAIEVIAGLGIALGLYTRILAFISSGEMAFAYLSHSSGSGSIWWWENRGELALLYAFLWLYFAARGAGPVSVDAWRKRA